MQKQGTYRVALAALGCAAWLGCVTASQVSELTGPLTIGEEPLAFQETKVADSAVALDLVAARAHANAELIAVVGDVVEQAAERALEAERLARGNLEPEIVYEIDPLPFASGSAALDSSVISALDQLGERLLMENAGYFLEVCGDASGYGGESRRLGAARADAIRRHLYERHGLPLRRIGTIAGGCLGAVSATAAAQSAGRDRARVLVLRQASLP